MKKTKNILFYYTDSKFKTYVKDASPKMYNQSTFIRENNKDCLKTKNFAGIEILSIFVDSTLEKQCLKNFPDLKYIATRSTGTDHIDKKYCDKNGIEILSVPDYGNETVAEFALASLLFMLKNLGNDNIGEKNRGLDLAGKTVGIIGAGKIGKNFIERVASFGTDILISDPNKDQFFANKHNAKYVTLDNLLKNADIISLHAPLCTATKHLLGAKEFKKMKDGVIIVNTARGALVDTKQLYKNLINDKISQAALDVLENEQDLDKPNKTLSKNRKEIKDLNKKIIKHKNVFHTPHQAYNTHEAVERIWKKTVQNITQLL